MKTITIHVAEETYRTYQEEAARTNSTASRLIRDAMEEYYRNHFAREGSVFDSEPARLGTPIAPLSPSDDLLEEMLP